MNYLAFPGVLVDPRRVRKLAEGHQTSYQRKVENCGAVFRSCFSLFVESPKATEGQETFSLRPMPAQCPPFDEGDLKFTDFSGDSGVNYRWTGLSKSQNLPYCCRNEGGSPLMSDLNRGIMKFQGADTPKAIVVSAILVLGSIAGLIVWAMTSAYSF